MNPVIKYGGIFVVSVVVILLIAYGVSSSSSSTSTTAAVTTTASPVTTTTAAPVTTTTAAPVTTTAAPVTTTTAAPVTTTAAPVHPSYLGCYKDATSSSRVFPNTASGVTTVGQCNSLAKANGSPYFGMQYWQQSGNTIGNTAQCWYGTSSTTASGTQQFGTTNTCSVGTDGNSYGPGYVNAIYQVA